jgi:hypothetical protein
MDVYNTQSIVVSGTTTYHRMKGMARLQYFSNAFMALRKEYSEWCTLYIRQPSIAFSLSPKCRALWGESFSLASTTIWLHWSHMRRHYNN